MQGEPAPVEDLTSSQTGESTRSDTRPALAGAIPSAQDSLKEVTRIVIRSDADFRQSDVAKFVSGSGTLADPYVFEGLKVLHNLYIQDTTVPIVVRNNYIAGRLSLNYNAADVHVHHNYIGDLRVNENIRRVQDQTGGVIEHNKIGAIGQIRHYNGEVRYNEIGPRPSHVARDYLGDTGILFLKDKQVVNFDGWHNARMHHNVIDGYVELQLHGHSHGSCFECEPHNHADAQKSAMYDHTTRFHRFEFTDNEVKIDNGVAVRYTDVGHAGDDRTAASEDDETLRKPHVHFTQIVIARNTLVGGSLVVDVFNAKDKLHEMVNPGTLTIEDNVVRAIEGERPVWWLWGWGHRSAIEIHTSRDVDLRVAGNEAVFTAREKGPLEQAPLVGRWFGGDDPAAIRLTGFANANLAILDNRGAADAYGIDARDFDERTTWHLSGNQFQAPEPVHYDESVKNGPS